MGYRNDDVSFPTEDDVHRVEASGQRLVFATVRLDIVFPPDETESIVRVFKDTASIRAQEKPTESRSPISPPQLDRGHLRVTWQYPPRLRPNGTRVPVSSLWCDEPGYGGVTWLAGAKYAWRGWKQKVLTEPRDFYNVGMLRFFSQGRDPKLGTEQDIQEDGVPFLAGSPSESHDSRSGNGVITVVESLRRLGEYAHGQGIGPDDPRRKWEQTLQEQFSNICSPKRYLGYWYDHPRFGETPLLEDDGRQYPFKNAASGEQVILQYLTQFTFPRPLRNSLILIDEPELHLHPGWVRQLYRALPMMGHNNQFIMTTHSVELRQLAAQDNVLVDLGALDEASRNLVNA